MTAVTFEYTLRRSCTEREEKAVRDIEKSLSGLTFGEIKQILAKVINQMDISKYCIEAEGLK